MTHLDQFTGTQRIAYFSMEIALQNDIPTYSGGLGILAGDSMRSAADLEIPMVAASLTSHAGYFEQEIDAEGRQVEHPSRWKPSQQATHLEAKVAIANARLAYQHYKTAFSTPHWEALYECGAQSQRLLWASTGTKNPAYSDTLYIEELIGPNTVNTAPPATLDAFREHGRIRASLDADIAGATMIMNRFNACGISLDITDQLLTDGIRLFDEAYDNMLDAIAAQRLQR